MKRIRNLGLAALMALALSAVFGAGSASAAPSEIYNPVGLYPLTVSGTQTGSNHILSLPDHYPSTECQTAPPLSEGKLSEGSSTLTLTPGSFKCSTWGSTNGCKFTLHTGIERPDGTFAGTLDIGPSGCGPITWPGNGSCHIQIPSQKDLRVSLANSGTGVKLTSRLVGMTYIQTNFCTGTFHDGSYQGSWQLQGSGGSSIGIQEDSPAPKGYVADEYPATVSGAQVFKAPFNLRFGKTDGSELTCEVAALAGQLAGPSATLSLAPTYSGCKLISAIGLLKATVNLNGCVYLLYEESGTVDIDCPEGKAIEVLANPCKKVIPEQKGLTAVQGESTTEGGSFFGISLKWSAVDNLAIKHEKLNLFCPTPNTESTDGSFNGNTRVIATDANEYGLGVWEN